MLRQEGVDEEKITVVTLVTCPEAADGFCQKFGDARLVTAAFDAALDKSGNIIPGIGDFEDRYVIEDSAAIEAAADATVVEGNDGNDKSDVVKKTPGRWPFGGK
jgi:hypothetical protein